MTWEFISVRRGEGAILHMSHKGLFSHLECNLKGGPPPKQIPDTIPSPDNLWPLVNLPKIQFYLALECDSQRAHIR